MYPSSTKNLDRSIIPSKKEGLSLLNLAIWLIKAAKRPRNFSLAILFLSGIFYPTHLWGVQTLPYATSTSEILIASFTFYPSAALQERNNIFPDRVIFNASGTGQTYIAIATPQNFPVWKDTYHAASWELRTSAEIFPSVFAGYPQALQIDSAMTANLPKDTVFVSAIMPVPPYEILLKAYSTEASLLGASVGGVTETIASPGIFKPYTLLFLAGKLHFLYVSSADNRIHYRTYDGNALSAETVFSNTDLDTSCGLSGCIIKSGANEYLALTYARSLTEIAIVTFKPGELNNSATATLTIGSFDSPMVNISQNPRTGKVYLLWQNTEIGYYWGGTFVSPGNFSFPSLPSPEAEKGSFGSGFEKFYGNSCMSYSNFENCFVLPTASGNAVTSHFSHGTTVTTADSAGPLAYPVQFPCTFSGTQYAGLINISTNSKTFSFYRRKLPFPARAWWQNPEKVLHIEGPPLAGTQVSIEIDYAEPKAESSKTRTVNAGTVGGMRTLTSGYRVIASSSGNYFSLYFDKAMRLASYPFLIGVSTPVRLINPLDPTNPIPISHIPSTTNELLFEPDDDLLLNTTYEISIASSVIDFNGSQIYQGATFSFITQNSSSQVQADEINGISAYSASGFTGSIASGSEVNASATIYLRVDCIDPAFNTIDTTSVDLIKDDAAIPLSTITLTETLANSGVFAGNYTLTSPTAGRHTFKFKTLNTSIYHPVYVDFPDFAPGTPASAAVDVAVNSTITIIATESIDPTMVTSSNVVLTLDGSPVTATLSYNDPLKQITITPGSPLSSEKMYFVTVKDQKDVSGNPQLQPLIYSFTVEDKTSPAVTAVSPANLSTGILINSLLTLDFSENIAAATVDKNSVKLLKNGINASFSLSVSGSRVTVDPDDTPAGQMLTDSNYSIEVNNGIQDLKGNTLSPSPFTSTFSTIASQTPPSSISTVTLYSDNTFTSPLAAGTDYPATGTLFIQFSGVDGQSLTLDSTIASISTGQTAVLTELASASGVFRGSTSFAGLADRFSLKVQSTVSPAASAALLITWPSLAPASPASAAVNVLTTAALTIIADESIDSGLVNNSNIVLSLDGSPVAAAVAYNDALKQITITPAAALSSQKTYVVTINNQKDVSGNPQLQPLIYSFTVEDKTAPALTAVSPVNLTTGVLINSLLTLDFSESIAAATVDKNSVKLLKNGLNASYSLSVSGSRITIDPDDTVEGFLLTDSTYSIELNNGIQDLSNNPLSSTPYTSTFSTIASQTPPISVNTVTLYADNTFAAPIAAGADYSATGTLYIQFSGVDGQSLTQDITIASISTGQTAVLNETASASGVFQGSTTFSGLADRFSLRVQSTVTPAASASLFITWPGLVPANPASGAINVPVNSTISINADEPLNAGLVNSSNITLSLNGVVSASSVSYNSLLRQIIITPAALMASEKNYTVSVLNQTDLQSNPQTAPLIYTFTIEDKTPPTITGNFPAHGSTDITIDRFLTIAFSEAIAPASISKTSVKLTRNGVPASYSLELISGQLTIDPDDGADRGMTTDSTYNLELTSSVTDLAGNALLNVPEPYILSFSTQPRFSPPMEISNLSLYKDALLITSWGVEEQIPASATVYIKAIGIDGATQTRDLASISLNLSWGQNHAFSIAETASNSSGYYIGQFSFASLPLYGIPTPQPPVSAGKLTFSSTQTPSTAATLSVTFPEIMPSQTTVSAMTGAVPAADAVNARIDTGITLTFSDELLDAGNGSAISISSGSSLIAATKTLSADRRHITISPLLPLPFSSLITLNGIYSDSGLRSTVGNPLYRPFTFSFRTQAEKTPPLTITGIRLYPDASMSPLNAYVSGQDFIATGTLYIEASGQDGAPNTVDITSVSFSTGQSAELTETNAASGIFRGSIAYSNLSDGFVLSAVSTINPAASQSLKLSMPVLTPISPASGATDVSFATLVEIRANEALKATTVNSSSCKLFKNGIEVDGTVELLSDALTLRFSPTQNLEFGQSYTFRAEGILDLAGNPVEPPLIFSFKVQTAEYKPILITSIKVFSDSGYSTQLADGANIPPAALIFIEIAATDASPVTIDTTGAGLTTNASGNTLSANMIETSPDSGIFRGSMKAFADENALLTFFSETDNSKKTTVRTFQIPRYISFQPASGTTNLYLDTVFNIETNKALAGSSISTESIILAGSSGIASYNTTLTSSGRITLSTSLLPSETYYLKLTSIIKDTDGLALPETIGRFTTLTPELKDFRLFSDSAGLNMLANDSEIEAGRLVYTRLSAANVYLSTPETATAAFSDGLSTTSFQLTETAPGEFTGSFIVPESPDSILTVIPEGRVDLAGRLKIVSGFSLIAFSPASGAVNVPADVWPSWQFNHSIAAADLSSANFSLIRIKDMSSVPVSIRGGVTSKNVWLEVGGALPLLETFEMRLSETVKDTSGNSLGKALVTRFTTQPPPPPPTEIVSLKNYETMEYATATFAVANNDSLYLELIAKDTSFSTYETARVRLESSDPSLDGRELTLIEVSPPSGIYRLAVPLNVPPGVTIKIISQASPSMTVTVSARTRTLLTAIMPASGSNELFLDQPISLSFSESVDPGTLADGLRVKTSAGEEIPFGFSLADSNRTITVAPTTSYFLSTKHFLSINTSLRDIYGLFLLPQTSELTTRSEASATFDLYTGIPPRESQRVALTGEAVRGAINIIASTTDLYLATNETRICRFVSGDQTFDLNVTETSPGSFNGATDLSMFVSNQAKATLMFAGNPSLDFALASTPLLLSIYPASGSNNAGEFPDFSAAFSRKMASEGAENGLKVRIPAGILPTTRVGPATDSTMFTWQTQTALPAQASCSLTLSGMTDYLGQPLADYQHAFSTGGLQGLNVYSDSSFAQLIATSEISISQLFVEISASDTTKLAGRSFFLGVRRGTRATETVQLAVEPVSAQSGKFRCSLAIIDGKGIPRHSTGLFPGEWLELTSPELTSDLSLLYYRHSTSVGPQIIKDIRLYSEKFYAQKVVDLLQNPSLFIELEGDDLNWLTRDQTNVKVTSDSDPNGFELVLTENGTHSPLFRNFIKLSPNATDSNGQTLKVLPGQRIEIVSVTDPTVRVSIRYQPENGIRLFAVYPSPARGNSVTFRFYLNFATEVHLEIYDSAGDEIKGFRIRGQEGENSFTWKLPAHLANGVYFYQVEIAKESPHATGKRKSRGKFAVLR